MVGRQPGFWDGEERLRELSAQGDPLEKLAATVDWPAPNGGSSLSVSGRWHWLPSRLTVPEALTVAQIEGGVPGLAETAALIDEFQTMIRNRKPDALDAWLPQAEQGLLSSFARGVRADRAARGRRSRESPRMMGKSCRAAAAARPGGGSPDARRAGRPAAPQLGASGNRAGAAGRPVIPLT